MKAVRGADGGVVVDRLEEPPGSGELIDMRATSVCASDLLYLRYGTTKILGHELAGVRADGTPVVVEAMYGCMECPECLLGRYNLCPTHPQRALGITTDGGMSEQFLAPAGRLITLPTGLDVRDASIVEPATVAWHALRLAGAGPNTRVAIVGAGALGLLAAAGARRMGVTDIALEARHRFQIEAAERLGVPVGTDGLYDVVVEAAGTVESLSARSTWSDRTGRSSCSACTSGRSTSTGARCSTARHACCRRSATARTTGDARWRTRWRCSPPIRRSPAP